MLSSCIQVQRVSCNYGVSHRNRTITIIRERPRQEGREGPYLKQERDRVPSILTGDTWVEAADTFLWSMGPLISMNLTPPIRETYQGPLFQEVITCNASWRLAWHRGTAFNRQSHIIATRSISPCRHYL